MLSQSLKEVIFGYNLMNILQLQHLNTAWLFFLTVSLRIKGGFPFTYESGLTLHPLSIHWDFYVRQEDCYIEVILWVSLQLNSKTTNKYKVAKQLIFCYELWDSLVVLQDTQSLCRKKGKLHKLHFINDMSTMSKINLILPNFIKYSQVISKNWYKC